MRRLLLFALGVVTCLNSSSARDIATRTGQIYRDVKAIHVDKTGIGFIHRDGSAFLFFSALPPETRAEFEKSVTDADSIKPPPELVRSPDIVTLDGNLYQDVMVVLIERTGIRIIHRNGTGFLDYLNLQTPIRHKYGYSDTAYAAGMALKLQRQQAATETQRRVAAENVAREAAAQLRLAKAQADLAALQASISARDYSQKNYVNRDYSGDRYSGTGGAVQVGGYTRSNGTYVQSYTRGGRGR